MKHRTLLAVVIVLALAALSCSLSSLPSGEEPPPPTQAPAVSAGKTPAPPPPPAPPTESPRVRPVDSMVMVHVPAGEFLMGLDEVPSPRSGPPTSSFWMNSGPTAPR